MGFTLVQMGTYQKGAGMAGAILGVLLGSLCINTLGVRTSVIFFGSAQAATNLLYILLGQHPGEPLWLAFVVATDNFTGGLGTAAASVFITAICNKAYSATQFAMLSSVATIPLNFLGIFSGFLATGLGWPGFFTATTLAMVPALVTFLFLPRGYGDPSKGFELGVATPGPQPPPPGEEGTVVGGGGRQRTS